MILQLLSSRTTAGQKNLSSRYVAVLQHFCSTNLLYLFCFRPFKIIWKHSFAKIVGRQITPAYCPGSIQCSRLEWSTELILDHLKKLLDWSIVCAGSLQPAALNRSSAVGLSNLAPYYLHKRLELPYTVDSNLLAQACAREFLRSDRPFSETVQNPKSRKKTLQTDQELRKKITPNFFTIMKSHTPL